MGYGDDLMAIGEAMELAYKFKQPVSIGDGYIQQKSELFQNNPHIGESDLWLQHYPGNRPYIDYDKMLQEGSEKSGLPNVPKYKKKILKFVDQWYWQNYKPKPGKIFFSEEEKLNFPIIDADIFIEPNATRDNKDWGFAKYQTIVNSFPRLRFVQCQKPFLNGAIGIETSSFREACYLLHQTKLYIGPECGMHHAAAAFNMNAIVLFGGYISPQITGYSYHANMYDPDNRPACGSIKPCQHCKDAMNKITIQSVINQIICLL